MNNLLNVIVLADSGTEKLKALLKNPILWISVGVIIALLFIWYLIKRNIKANEGTNIVVVSKNSVKKILNGNDTNNNKYYLVPFVDKVGARFTLLNNSFNSDGLQVNDGPDKLYRINFSMKYDIVDSKVFYEVYKNDAESYMLNVINNTLRKYVYEGNGDVLLKNYMVESHKLVEVVNASLKDIGIDVKDFKVNTILLVK